MCQYLIFGIIKNGNSQRLSKDAHLPTRKQLNGTTKMKPESKIILAIGFTPFYENNAQAIIKIDDKLFTLVGKQTSELQPYPAMIIEEKHLLATLKEVVRYMEMEDKKKASSK